MSVLTARQVFRDYETDGVPDSGAHKPKKSEVRQWGAHLEELLYDATFPLADHHTITTDDAWKTLYVTGGFFTITLPTSVSGFADDAFVRIVNGDSARGKRLTGFPAGTLPILWPGQSIVVAVVAGLWKVVTSPIAWRHSTGVQTFHVDHANGNNANDGLASGAGNAWATIAHALQIIQAEFDCANNNPIIRVHSASFTESVSTSIAITGAQGCEIRGDASNPSACEWIVPSGSIGVQARDFAILFVNGFKFTTPGSGSTGISADQFGIVDYQNVEFGNFPSGVHVSITGGGHCNFIGGSYEISGNCTYHWFIFGPGSQMALNGAEVELPGALTFSQFLYLVGPSYFQSNGLTFTGPGAGSGSTGEKYFVAGNGFGNLGGATMPGATAGSTATGGQVL